MVGPTTVNRIMDVRIVPREPSLFRRGVRCTGRLINCLVPDRSEGRVRFPAPEPDFHAGYAGWSPAPVLQTGTERFDSSTPYHFALVIQRLEYLTFNQGYDSSSLSGCTSFLYTKKLIGPPQRSSRRRSPEQNAITEGSQCLGKSITLDGMPFLQAKNSFWNSSLLMKMVAGFGLGRSLRKRVTGEFQGNTVRRRPTL